MATQLPNAGATAVNPSEGARGEFVAERLPVGWPWRLLVFSIIIFLLVLFVYFGIRFGYTAYLEGSSAEIDHSLDALGSEVNAADQERFVSFYSQIVNLKSVLDLHFLSGNTLSFLERNVIDGVVFTGARFKATERTLVLEGSTGTFDMLAQQMGVFEKSRDVEKVFLEDTSISAGGITFKLSVYFRDEFLKGSASA